MAAAVTVELQVSNTAVSTTNTASTTASPAVNTHGSIKRIDPPLEKNATAHTP